ncbi:MAG: hypothetical protein IJE59_05070 [Clostridia bacterium]|nr:hypothetical protein [Clostridia bacterium]
MDSQATEQLVQMLVYILIPVIIAVFVLIGFLIYIHFKEKTRGDKKETKIQGEKLESNNSQNKQSIFKFMEFDDVEDNMIIQKNATKYLMVIECQGVNYDLMSGVEKNSVEEGFVQFLNSLRDSIQIYIQTRAVNLENSLEGYKEKIKEIENKYISMKAQYEEMLNSEDYTDEQIARAHFELTKQSNLYEYGLSIIKDTERMSLNKNILNKNYYIIVPYLTAEAGSDKLDKKEMRNIAFSELYTRCQSIISSISVCGVKGKILRTNELIELLYMAYNRDEAETFSLDRALKSGYNELYSTAPDVYEKKMKELDKIIEEKAAEKAREKIREAKSELQRQVEEKENNIDDIINDVAKLLLEENEQYIGKEVKELALDKLENTKEGGKTNGKKTRGRSKNTRI